MSRANQPPVQQMQNLQVNEEERNSPPRIEYTPIGVFPRPPDRFDGDRPYDLSGDANADARKFLFEQFTTAELLDRRRCSRTWRDAIHAHFGRVKQVRIFYDYHDAEAYALFTERAGLTQTSYNLQEQGSQVNLLCVNLDGVIRSNILRHFANSATDLVVFYDPPESLGPGQPTARLNLAQVMDFMPKIHSVALLSYRRGGKLQDLMAFKSVRRFILVQPASDVYDQLEGLEGLPPVTIANRRVRFRRILDLVNPPPREPAFDVDNPMEGGATAGDAMLLYGLIYPRQPN